MVKSVVGPNISNELRNRLADIPIFSALDIEVISVTSEAATLKMPFRRDMAGIFESLHGGLLMTLADTAACVAVLAEVGSHELIATTDMSIRFLERCLTAATASARIVKAGRTLCPVDVRINDERGSLVAIAQVTYIRIGPRQQVR